MKKNVHNYKIVPTTKEFVPAEKNAFLPLDQKCGHKRTPVMYYPGLTWDGMIEPFAILLSLCAECAKTATVESILTKERWKRMQMILITHDEKIPARGSIKLTMIKSIEGAFPGRDEDKFASEADSYSYALAA